MNRGYIEFTNPVSVRFSTIKTPPNMRMQLFSNNAQVYYKPGSLAPGGVGSVRNASAKSKKT